MFDNLSFFLNFPGLQREEISLYFGQRRYWDFLRTVVSESPEAFFRSKFYRIFSVYSWRIRSAYFPLKYWIIGNVKIPLNKWIRNILSVLYPHRNIESCNTPDTNHKNARSGSGPLPMEIWSEASKYDINPANLVRVNRSFCNTFAPKIYEEMDMYLLISSTDKMTLNDACFLKYGDDFPDIHRSNGYEIYERHQKSAEYDYEILDVTKRPEWIEDKKSHNERLITDGTKISCIFRNILGNPNSILKRYVKDVTTTIQILHGFGDLVGIEHENFEADPNYLFKKSNLRGTSFAFLLPGYYWALDLNEKFDGDRWDQPQSLSLRSYYDLGLLDAKRKNTCETFPTNVYGREMVAVGLMLDFMQNKQLRQDIKKVNKINPANYTVPFHSWCIQTQRASSRFLAVCFLKNMSLNKIASVQINSRNFFKKKNVRSLLDLIMKTSTSTSKTKFFLMVAGQSNERISESMELDTLVEQGISSTSRYFKYKPILLVINNKQLQEPD